MFAGIRRGRFDRGRYNGRMRVLALIVATGSATTQSIGAQGIAGGQTGSVEATAAGGLGVGSSDDAFYTKVTGTLGGGPRGVQGRVMVADEYISFGDKIGWQAHVGAGASRGNYQSPDLALE